MYCVISCNGKALLLAVLALNLVLILTRQVLDSWARLWLCMAMNFLQLLMLLFAFFGVCQNRLRLIVVYLISFPIWIAWNVFLVCYYLNVGVLNSASNLVSLFTEESSWWNHRFPSVDFTVIEVASAVSLALFAILAASLTLVFAGRIRQKNERGSLINGTCQSQTNLRPHMTIEVADNALIKGTTLLSRANGYQSDTTGYLNASYDDSPNCNNNNRSIATYVNAVQQASSGVMPGFGNTYDDSRDVRRSTSRRSKKKQRDQRFAQSNGTLSTMETAVFTNNLSITANNSKQPSECRAPRHESLERSSRRHSTKDRRNSYSGRTAPSRPRSPSPQSQTHVIANSFKIQTSSNYQNSEASHNSHRPEELPLESSRGNDRRRSYNKHRRKRSSNRRSTSADRYTSSASSVVSTYEVDCNPDPSRDTNFHTNSIGSRKGHSRSRATPVDVPKPPPILHASREKCDAIFSYDDEPRRISYNNSTYGEAVVSAAHRASSPLPNCLVSFDPKSDTVVRYHGNKDKTTKSRDNRDLALSFMKDHVGRGQLYQDKNAISTTTPFGDYKDEPNTPDSFYSYDSGLPLSSSVTTSLHTSSSNGGTVPGEANNRVEASVQQKPFRAPATVRPIIVADSAPQNFNNGGLIAAAKGAELNDYDFGDDWSTSSQATSTTQNHALPLLQQQHQYKYQHKIANIRPLPQIPTVNHTVGNLHAKPPVTATMAAFLAKYIAPEDGNIDELVDVQKRVETSSSNSVTQQPISYHQSNNKEDRISKSTANKLPSYGLLGQMAAERYSTKPPLITHQTQGHVLNPRGPDAMIDTALSYDTSWSAQNATHQPQQHLHTNNAFNGQVAMLSTEGPNVLRSGGNTTNFYNGCAVDSVILQDQGLLV